MKVEIYGSTNRTFVQLRHTIKSINPWNKIPNSTIFEVNVTRNEVKIKSLWKKNSQQQLCGKAANSYCFNMNFRRVRSISRFRSRSNFFAARNVFDLFWMRTPAFRQQSESESNTLPRRLMISQVSPRKHACFPKSYEFEYATHDDYYIWDVELRCFRLI